jgi:two-component system NtrC family sensor kinase
MKKSLQCFSLVLAFSHASAQKINVDSLVKIAISLNVKEEAIIPQNPDSLLRTLSVTKSPAARIRTVYDIILLDNGELNPTRALYYHHKILDLANENHDAIVEAVITGELGYLLYEDGDAPEGLKMIFDALKLAEKTGNKQAIGTVYDNLGICTDNTDASIAYFKKALQYSLAGDDNLFAIAELGNLSGAYQKKHHTDSATYFLIKAFELALRTHVQVFFIQFVAQLGSLQTDNQLKLKYYRYALMMSQSPRDAQGKGQILLQIAKVYQQELQTDSALVYAKNAYGLLNGKLLSRMLAPSQLLAQLYTGKNADSALKYTTTYYTIRDSLYSINKMQQAQSITFAEQQRQQELAAQKATYQTTLRLYLMAAVAIFLLVIAFIFWRNNRRNKKANLTLQSQKTQIQKTLQELRQTQTQLIQSEKMASLGELTAGIAHEIQNPLNFVNNFSEVNTELIDEAGQEIEKGNIDEVKIILNDIKENEQKINHHGKRAEAIVKGMLQHSRSSTGVKEPTDINASCDEYLRLAYHGLRAKDKPFNADFKTDFDNSIGKINIIPQDIGRVLLNLINNAFYAVDERQKITKENLPTGQAGYQPTVFLSSKKSGDKVILTVKDNGNGIPQNIVDKIFQPFFTTKPTGQGTGLGLSLSYDIVKAHGGEIKVETKEGEGSTFIIQLPI